MFEFRFDISSQSLEAVEEFLWDLGATSFSFSQDEDIYEIKSTEVEVVDGMVMCVATFEETLEPDILSDLEIKFKLTNLAQKKCEIRDWQREFEEHFGVMEVSDEFCIIPSHIRQETSKKFLRIIPGLAFGTGDHETTKMCLRWLSSIDMIGKRLLDFGSGSGILGLSAMVLGAKYATLVDNDEQAIFASVENAKLNSITDVEFNPDLTNKKASYDILVANIYSRVLVELLPLFATLATPSARVGFTGILSRDADEFLAEVNEYFDDVKITQQVGEWVFFSNG